MSFAQKIFFVFLLVIAFFASQIPKVFDQKTRLVFCNVGEGDGAVLTTPKNVFLIDAGRNSRMRACLARHLPFFRREITGVIITHPDADHVKGLKSVIQSYKVKYLFSNFSAKKNSDYSEIIDILRNRGVIYKSFTAGEEISVVGAVLKPALKIKSLWPLNEHSEAAGDTNLFSTVSIVTIGKSRFLMLADAEIATQISLLPEIVNYSFVETQHAASHAGTHDVVGIASMNLGSSASLQNNIGNENRFLVVKLAHHGSAKNFSYALIREAQPRYAVVSVGQNKYGHPGKRVLEMLSNVGVPLQKIEILRTDQMGDIVFECEKECELKN